jgi:hypothetical protein
MTANAPEVSPKRHTMTMITARKPPIGNGTA